MNKTVLSNIQETYNGIKYAFNPEDEYNTEYIAECKEYDEFFRAKFYAKSDYTNEQLMEIGIELAQIWGAKCLKVVKV